jgi:calpain, invertebrate
LLGGETTDALIDMTGGIQESFEIKDMRTDKQKNEIWDLIIKSRKHKSIIAASIAPKPRIREARLANGLVMGHAYTITKVAALEAGTREIRLLRVRNPW